MLVVLGENKLLLVLLVACFSVVAASARAGFTGEREPEIYTIGFSEAVKIAMDLLPGRKPAEYEDREFEIIMAEKSTTKSMPAPSEFMLEELVYMLDDINARERPGYSEYIRDTNRKLDGRIYWFIYFVPAGHKAGDGGVGFFIDAATSELVEVYRDK